MKFLKQLNQIIITTIVLINSSGHAGTGNSGGANEIDGMFLDFYEGQGRVEFDYMELKSFEEVLAPQLEKIDLVYPDFSEALLGQSEKIWSFQDKAIHNDQCLNLGLMVQAKKEIKIIACQNDTEVVIDKELFMSKSLKTQAAIISHELLVGLMLSGPGKSALLERNLRALNRDIYTFSKLKADIFRNNLFIRKMNSLFGNENLLKSDEKSDYKHIIKGFITNEIAKLSTAHYSDSSEKIFSEYERKKLLGYLIIRTKEFYEKKDNYNDPVTNYLVEYNSEIIEKKVRLVEQIISKHKFEFSSNVLRDNVNWQENPDKYKQELWQRISKRSIEELKEIIE